MNQSKMLHGIALRDLEYAKTPDIARLPITVRPFEYRDASEICSWVTTAEELERISGDRAEELHPDILLRWHEQCGDALVLQSGIDPVAFCTLSTMEYDLPHKWVEVCHLVTIPSQRRKYFATTLLHFVRLVAAQRSYQRLVGRIVPSNEPGLKLAWYARWQELVEKQRMFDPTFKWFSYELKK